MANSTDENPLLKAILDGPALPPPVGTASNFVDPPSNGIAGLIVATISMGIGTVMIIIRIFTKLYLMKAWNIEDYLIVPAWGAQIYFTYEVYMLIQHGAGIDMWNISLSTFLSQDANNLAIVYSIIVALIKLAILFQYLRIFVPHRGASLALWWTIFLTMVTIIIFYTIVTGFLIGVCNPVEKLWNPFLDGSCFDSAAIYEATGVFNIISDFALFLIPVWPVWKLHLPTGKRLGIIALFATGLLDCLSSILRTYETWIIYEVGNVSSSIIVMGCWAAAEIGIGIVVCCLPIMPRFLQFLHPRFQLKSSTTKPSRARSGHDYVSHVSHHEHSDMYPMTAPVHELPGREEMSNSIKVESSINIEYMDQSHRSV